jgi:hypothetical protein
MFWPVGLLLQLNEDLGYISNCQDFDSFDFYAHFGCAFRHDSKSLSNNEISQA